MKVRMTRSMRSALCSEAKRRQGCVWDTELRRCVSTLRDLQSRRLPKPETPERKP